MDKVVVKKVNEVYNKIICPPSIAYELRSKFTFKAHNYKFHPLYKARKWNGDISLYNMRDNTLYAGLLHYVEDFCEKNQYELEIRDNLELQDEFSVYEAKKFIETLNIPLEEREYQVESFVDCVRHKRTLFVSPTGSGKSLIIYLLVRWYNSKTLIIVDSLNLLNQMYSDFAKYGFDSEKNIHMIYSGEKKTSEKPVIITTWQSAAKQPKEWFDQFDIVIGDEAHRYKATSLKKIMESLTNCKYRFGLTGSLDGSQVNQLTLEGLFGPYKRRKTTKDLIDEGYLSDVEIKILMLKYSDVERKVHSKDSYQDELDFLYSHDKRNRFIENLALSLKGNTLLLFQRIESHGVPLYDSLLSRTNGIPIYYVSGKTDMDDREEIRKIVNTHENSITVASVGTFATGIDIPNINSIIMSSPTKSAIRIIQSIGRGLRKTDIKTKCTVFDIADNLQWKRKLNYTLKHHVERLKIYINEQHKYTIYQVDISK